MAEDWVEYLLDTDDAIGALLARASRVAVLGIKTEAALGQPAYDVPRALQRDGLTVIPVPVYYPDATHILGEPVFRSVAEVPAPPVDIVQVFRRSADVAAHLPDLLAAKPHAVWMQLGIRDDVTAQRLARVGIAVVQDRCLKVERQRRGL
jgi:uncharacterized protein